jgi:sterol desaturase/sphingolipid hydroxylase (fatty acid hydroxylase superfamily)
MHAPVHGGNDNNTVILLIVTFIAFSWLAMQVVHEMGHVLVARLTSGEALKVALHPLIISRTDLGENPHPLAVVWGGPLVGSIFPLLLLALASACRLHGLYMFRFFAGFCLVANEVYIGIGWAFADGADPSVMTENGSPRWLLVLFGLLAAPLGLYLWHRQGPRFGLGEAKGNVNVRAALTSAALFLALTGAELLRTVR